MYWSKSPSPLCCAVTRQIDPPTWNIHLKISTNARNKNWEIHVTCQCIWSESLSASVLCCYKTDWPPRPLPGVPLSPSNTTCTCPLEQLGSVSTHPFLFTGKDFVNIAPLPHLNDTRARNWLNVTRLCTSTVTFPRQRVITFHFSPLCKYTLGEKKKSASLFCRIS